MAKGRRLTTSRSDRLLGVGTFSYGNGHAHHQADVAVSEVVELGEEEVWSMMEDTSENHNHHHHRGYGSSAGDWQPRAAADSGRRRAQQGDNHHHVGGLSLAFDDKTPSSNHHHQHQRIVHQFGGGGGGGGSRAGRHVAASAPVNVPDWSKILRVNSVESIHDSDEDDNGVGGGSVEPPHEYLARSRKTNAMSVYEGVGRTLKGRDLSRVRDAVWSQTGFEG